MVTFPLCLTLPPVPFAVQVAPAASLLPRVTLPSSKGTWGPQLCSCTGRALLSAQAAGKCPCTSQCAQGCSSGLPPHLPGTLSLLSLGSLTVQR